MLSDKLFFWLFQAQMGPDPGFLRRLYAETARLLQQEPGITNWRVVVITPSRQLNLGAAEPVAEFLERRVSWVELQPVRGLATAPLFKRLLALLVQPEACTVQRSSDRGDLCHGWHHG